MEIPSEEELVELDPLERRNITRVGRLDREWVPVPESTWDPSVFRRED